MADNTNNNSSVKPWRSRGSRRSMRSRRLSKIQKSSEFHTVRNPILGKDVEMNDSAYESYINMVSLNPDIYPYQSEDLRRKGNIRLAHKDRIEQYKENKREFLRVMHGIKRNSNMVFDLVSDIDIYKMRRNDPNTDAKYLIQQDPHVAYHLQNMVRLQTKLDATDDFIFLPYILLDESHMTVDNIEIKPHNMYGNVNIVNNKEFVTYLKTIVDISPGSNELGELIFEFNKIFYYYDQMLAILSEYINETVTEDNLIDKVIQFEKMRIYGITKDIISRRLKRRNDELKDFRSAESCVPDEYYDHYFELLSNGDKIEELDIITDIQNCNAGSIDFNDLIYEEINDFEADSQYLDFCKTMKFAPTDTFAGRTNQPMCRPFINKIRNDDVRNVLLRDPVTDIAKSRCLNLSDQIHENVRNFKILEHFMPEWHEEVYQNNLKGAFSHRQLLLGDTKVTTFFRNCTSLFRSDPFISKECILPGLIHDIELNKVVVSCVASSDDIFPIRLVDGNLIESIQMYEPFKVTENDRLLGSIMLRMKGERTDQEYRYYNNHLYYNKDKRFKLIPVNFRSNVIIPGTIIEHVRVLYLEMNTLLYYGEDIGAKLHFYKYIIGDNFDILVSKYTMDEIVDKYRSLSSFDDSIFEELNKLTEVKLEKDFDKKFKFVEMKQNGTGQTGGSNINDETNGYRFDFKCLGKENYKWNIKTGNKPAMFDKEVFSLSLHSEQIKLVDRFFDDAGKEVYNIKCMPINYLKGVTTPAMAKLQTDKIKQLWESEGIHKKDKTGKLYESTLNLIKENQTVLSYNFESTLSIYFYHQLNNYLKPNFGTKYVIFSKNHYLLDALALYSKAVLLKNISKDITFFLYAYNYQVFDKVTNYLQVNKIKPVMIDRPMNNDWIENYEKELDNVDYSIVDIVIGIDQLALIRYTYLFQSQLSPIILSLKKLNKGGVLVVNINLIPNKMVFNFVSYLSCFFEEVFVDDFWESDLHATGQLIHSIVIFNGFKGINDNEMNNMIDLNKMMYEFDETGGYKYDVNSDDKTEGREVASQYVTSIFDFTGDQNIISNEYNTYKEYVKMKFLGSIRNFTQRMDIFTNEDDVQKINEICTKAKSMALYYATKYNFPLLDWAEDIPNKYFDRMIGDHFKSIDYSFYNDLPKIDGVQLELSDNVQCNYCEKLEDNYAISELTYLYIEKVNYDKYKGIELFVNKKYKNLNRLLQKEYGININDKYVSRAWIKFYELLSDVKLLEGFEHNEKLNVFHICEAPGNFVNSMKHFVYTNTEIEDLDWNAQSLSAELKGFGDYYGFIKQTKDQWDKGPKNTGDIMDKENMKYYLDKYGGVDFLIGDCGEAWDGAVPDNKNLSIYQMFYGLLVPRTGGGFVIKTYAGNYNKLYMSLLYVACSLYGSITIFKSNTNFWSQEVYIVGKKKKELSSDNKMVLLECLKNLDEGNTTYPIKELPDDFVKAYDKIVYQLVSFASNIKKFFVFLSTNDQIYHSNKDKIAKIIEDKNRGWMNKYLKMDNE
jgi:23S rRNA U2552 (ribose-2'-O)-methylase RlmE/FtsJ